MKACSTLSSQKAVAIVSGYKLGNPLDPATTLGPMANMRFADLVRSQIAEAVGRGRHGSYRCHRAADDGGAYLHRRFSPT